MSCFKPSGRGLLGATEIKATGARQAPRLTTLTPGDSQVFIARSEEFLESQVP